MKRPIFFTLILLMAAAGLWAQAASIEYLVVPSESSAPGISAAFNPSKPQYFPMLTANSSKKILFFLEPMGRKIKSYAPKKDSMGMDYIPVYVDEAGRKLLWYVNPMDPSIHSDTAMKDHMGMDYIPVYQLRLFTK
jgi:hypothetical protein